MKSQMISMGAASVLLVSLACGCVAETSSDPGTSAGEKADKTEQLRTRQSAVVVGNPPGYNPGGYYPYTGGDLPGDNPPGYNPYTGNPPGTDVGNVYGVVNPPGYNPPGYNPHTGNPPGYNPPGTGYGYGVANPPGYNPPGYNPATGNPPGYNPPGTY